MAKEDSRPIPSKKRSSLSLDGARSKQIVTLEPVGRKRPKRLKVVVESSFLSPEKRTILKGHLDGHLKLKPSTIPGAGSGVFAAKDLPKGFQLPYLGKVYHGKFDAIIEVMDAKEEDLLYIFHDEKNSLVIDGHPRYNSLACNLAFRINEPPKGQTASLDFVSTKGWAKDFSTICARTVRPIKKGEELFVDYGESYDRSHYEKK